MEWKTLIFHLGTALAMGICLALSSVPIAQAQVASDSTNFDFDKVVKAIKQEIQAARAEGALEPKLKIDRVEIELAVVMKQGIEGGLKVKVANFGAQITGGGSKETSHTIRLVLIPTGNIEIGNVPSLGLATAIHNVKGALRTALNTPPTSFTLDTFTFEVEIAIEKTEEGGLSFFFVDSGLKQRNLATHHVKIDMSLAKK